jgi:Mrp family chromosome partitioning ATPase
LRKVKPEKIDTVTEFYEVPEEGVSANLVVQSPTSASGEKDYPKAAVAGPGPNFPDESPKTDLNKSLSLPRSRVNNGNSNNNNGKRFEVVKENQNAAISNSQLTHERDRTGREIAEFTPDFGNVSISERFHLMIQQLGFTPSLEQPVVIGVASSVRGEGRTTVALGLANALSEQTPLPVLLLEADLTQPVLANGLEMTNLGLCEYLRGELPIHCDTLNDLTIMFAGEVNGEALKTLRSSRLDDLFDELVRQYAVIVVDLPPLAMIAESSRLLNQVDRVLMVTQAGVTPARLVRSAMALIPEEKRSGVVLNRTRPAFGPFHWLSRLFHRTI